MVELYTSTFRLNVQKLDQAVLDLWVVDQVSGDAFLFKLVGTQLENLLLLVCMLGKRLVEVFQIAVTDEDEPFRYGHVPLQTLRMPAEITHTPLIKYKEVGTRESAVVRDDEPCLTAAAQCVQQCSLHIVFRTYAAAQAFAPAIATGRDA